MTPGEMSKFLGKLPEETAVVLVVQAGKYRYIWRTDSLEADFPNWPQAVWDGIEDFVRSEGNTRPPR